MSDTTVVIMAAGLGNRYGGLKQMDDFGPHGELIIDYSIYDALRAGFKKVVFVIKKSIEQEFREVIGKRVEKFCDVAYIFQELDKIPSHFEVLPERHKPWGTGQATLLCKDAVKGNFAVINADDFYGASSFLLLSEFLCMVKDNPKVYSYAMIGYLLKNTITEHGHVARGVCIKNKEGFLTEIHELTRIEKFGNEAKFSEDGGETWVELPLDCTVSMNMWGFTPSIFEELQRYFEEFLEKSLQDPKAEFFLPEVVGALLHEGKANVTVIPTQARWAGVTYHDDKASVKAYLHSLVVAGEYPEKLWS